jgi:peptidoglycan/xylan/chitin deacetylase (PgdA/CDA1 family)
MRRGLTILTYHRVLPWEQCIDYPLPALVIPTEVFRRQIQWLADHCRVLPVCKALTSLGESDTSGKPLVAVTFDDGYDDNFEHAAPILEACGLRGTFYVASGFVATGQTQWYDRAAVAWRHVAKSHADRLLAVLHRAAGDHLPADRNGLGAAAAWMEGLKTVAPEVRQEMISLAEQLAGHPLEQLCYRPMRPEQVRTLHAKGHEIGSHTVSHPILPQMANGELTCELQQSAIQLSQWTGSDITGFCYPNGDYDTRVERTVIQAGYRYACTTREGFNRPGGHPFRLERLPMTMRRTMCGHHYEPLGFRAELSRFRALLRL